MNPPTEPPYEPVLHVVLHEPAIPPNTGNIGRTCVAVAAKLWLVRPLGFELTERQLRRAGLDYWPHLNWQVVDDWDELMTYLGNNRRWLFTKTANQSYLEPRYERGDCLVFGSETSGLPKELLAAHPSHTLRIPMREQVRSLNLSASAAIAVYEAMRQIESVQVSMTKSQ